MPSFVYQVAGCGDTAEEGGGEDEKHDHPGLMCSNRGISAGGAGFIAQRYQATSNAKAAKHRMVTASAKELISFLEGSNKDKVCLNIAEEFFLYLKIRVKVAPQNNPFLIVCEGNHNYDNFQRRRPVTCKCPATAG